MAKYYARNNENLLPVFKADGGKDAGGFSQAHVAHEFRMAVPINEIQQLFTDVFSDTGTTMWGGAGSFMEKQKERVARGELTILDAKAATTKMAEQGEISYKRTLLGGCTKPGPCDDFLLGDATACLSCEGAAIESTKLNKAIIKSEDEQSNYKPGSAEYQLLESEIKDFKKFRSKKLKLISTVEAT